MSDKTPLKVITDTAGNATSVGEFNSGDSIPIASGGTGATNAAQARTNLGIGTAVSVNSDTHAALAKTPPVDLDEFPLVDSAAAWGLKKLTWSNLKAAMKIALDSYYLPLAGTAANSSKLLNGTWASPGYIGQTTPATINAAILHVNKPGEFLPTGNLDIVPNGAPYEIRMHIDGNLTHELVSTDKYTWRNLTDEVMRLGGDGSFTVGGDYLSPNFEVVNAPSPTKHIKISGNTIGDPYITSSTGGNINFPVTISAAGINSTTIGAATPSTGDFTTLSASGTVSGAGFTSFLTAALTAPGPIGSVTPSTAAFTTLSVSSTVSGAGFTAYFASPPAIGGTAANSGAFTTLGASGAANLTNTLQVGGTAAIGVAPVGYANLYLNKSLDGTSSGGNAYAVYNLANIVAGTTAVGAGFLTSIGIASGATPAAVRHFVAAQGTFTGSTTSQAGFHVESNLTGATNNYGFYGAIAAAAGRWNFIAAGTANNAFAGNSSFGKISVPTCAVDGTSHAFNLVTNAAGTYSVLTTDSTIIQTTAASTYTLPAAASFPGRKLHLVTQFAGTVISASSNVVPLAGGAAGTAILAATAGKFAELQSNGTNWVIIAAN